MENKTYGILGQNLKNICLSEFYRYLGISDFNSFEITQDKLSSFIKAREFDGLSVTVPYMRTVMPLLSKTSELARKIGCVNTVIKNENGKLFGENTEVYGFLFLLDFYGIDVSGKSCLIIGDGSGSIAAAKLALEYKGAAEMWGMTRTAGVRLADYEKIADVEIIINTVVIGSSAEEKALNIEGLEKLEAVIDINCRPFNTKLISDAKAMGIPTYDGFLMLSAQAKRTKELFSGEDIDDSVVQTCADAVKKEFLSIALIGAADVDKAEIGKILAQKLGKRHVDIDATVDMLYGKAAHKEGETEFRRVEHVAAEWAGKRAGLVISAGDGIVARPDNRISLSQNGIIVFLNSDGACDDRLSLYREWCDHEVEYSQSIEETVDKIIEILDF
jgi:shikimate dehydrogenase